MNFDPALDSVTSVDADTYTLHATSLDPITIEAKVQEKIYSFTQVPSSNPKVYAYTVEVPISSGDTTVQILATHESITSPACIHFVKKMMPVFAKNNTVKIELKEGMDHSCTLIDPGNETERWIWKRKNGVVVPEFQVGTETSSSTEMAHVVLSRPNRYSDLDASITTCWLAHSTQSAIAYLATERPDQEPGLYLHLRRASSYSETSGAKAYAYLSMATSDSPTDALNQCVKLTGGISDSSSQGLYHCSPKSSHLLSNSITFGESADPSVGFALNQENLQYVLTKTKYPERTKTSGYLIGNGWQNIRINNGFQRLWSFEARLELGSVSEMVKTIKLHHPSINQIGITVSMLGYFGSIDTESPLVKQYKMQMFDFHPHLLPTENLPSENDGSLPHSILLPSQSSAFDFWSDYFTLFAEAGISYIKVEHGAYGEFLKTADGIETYSFSWDSLLKASERIFGKNCIIHDMGYGCRTIGGDHAMDDALQLSLFPRNSTFYSIDQTLMMAILAHSHGYSCIPREKISVSDMSEFVFKALLGGPLPLSAFKRISGLKDNTGVTRNGFTEQMRPQGNIEVLTDLWELSRAAITTAQVAVTGGHIMGLWNETKFSRASTIPAGGCIYCATDVFWNVDAHIVVEGNSAKSAYRVPIFDLPSYSVAVLGLVDRPAGLTAIESVKCTDDLIQVTVKYAGYFTFVVRRRDAYTPEHSLEVRVGGGVVGHKSKKIDSRTEFKAIELVPDETIDRWFIRIRTV